MTGLLPPNATPLERGLEAATARLSDVPVPLRDLWNPATCPAHLLPWLGWGLSIDFWDASWTEAEKRTAIAATIERQRRKGTLASLREVIDRFDPMIRIVEWFEDRDTLQPHTFRLELPLSAETAVAYDEPLVRALLRDIGTVKPLRSHMQAVHRIAVRTNAFLTNGAQIAGFTRFTSASDIAVTNDPIWADYLQTEDGEPVTAPDGEFLVAVTPVLPTADLLTYAATAAVWDTSALSTQFADAAGTTPAEAGGPVRLLRDLGPNGFDMVAPSDAQRPLAANGLTFDDVNDMLVAEAFNGLANATLVCIYRGTDTKANFWSSESGYAISIDAAAGGMTTSAGGIIHVDGIATAATSRLQLHAEVADGQPHELAIIGCNLGAWQRLAFANNYSFTNNVASGVALPVALLDRGAADHDDALAAARTFAAHLMAALQL